MSSSGGQCDASTVSKGMDHCDHYMADQECEERLEVVFTKLGTLFDLF
jgi:hypothetical protein